VLTVLLVLVTEAELESVEEERVVETTLRPKSATEDEFVAELDTELVTELDVETTVCELEPEIVCELELTLELLTADEVEDVAELLKLFDAEQEEHAGSTGDA
jgi:hypothetical protein